MNCPRCQSQALRMEQTPEVTIDRCPGCHGMWLDELELEQLVEQSPRTLLADDARFAPAVVNDEPLKCPRCQSVPLIKLNSRLRPGTVVDSCQVCFGVWLDAGELSRLAHQDFAQSIYAVFRG